MSGRGLEAVEAPPPEGNLLEAIESADPKRARPLPAELDTQGAEERPW